MLATQYEVQVSPEAVEGISEYETEHSRRLWKYDDDSAVASIKNSLCAQTETILTMEAFGEAYIIVRNSRKEERRSNDALNVRKEPISIRFCTRPGNARSSKLLQNH